MTAFDAGWLALREPYDAASRPVDLIEPLCAALPAGPINVIDLGAGTGSNLRYLAPRLGRPQTWRLIDHDARLLDLALQTPTTLADGTLTIDGQREDLATGIAAIDMTGAHLVTASALLDLVSSDWCAALAVACRAERTAILMALTYTGTIAWHDEDADDAFVTPLVNRDQRTDKGFGPALGPDAAETAGQLFTRHGFAVRTAASDWRFGPRDAAIQAALIADWGTAAKRIAPSASARVDAWATRRKAAVAAGCSSLTVGHVDLLAIPASEAGSGA